MAEYIQRGEVLDYITTGAVNSGDVLVLGSRIGVAGATAPKGATVAVHVVGVFSMPSAGEAIKAGDAVYWNGTAITKTAEGGTPAGYAFNTVKEADTLITVKIG